MAGLPIKTYIRFCAIMLCLSFVSYLYYNERIYHPHCLWNGAKLQPNTNNIEGRNCYKDDCDKLLCDYLTNNYGIYSVSVSLVEPIESYPNTIEKDFLWIGAIVLLSITAMMDFLKIAINCCTNDSVCCNNRNNEVQLNHNFD